MSSEMDPKYIYAQEHKLYYFFWITLHGIEKIETGKKITKTVFAVKCATMPDKVIIIEV